MVENVAAIGCIDCHMPAGERPIVPGGEVRPARRHLWRGGHDPKRALDGGGNVVAERTEKLIRRILWRPFIVDLWDTRLPRFEPRSYALEIEGDGRAVRVEAGVRYNLLEESRRRRIGYENRNHISYEVFRGGVEL